MSTESQSEIIWTATVGIFSPDMTKTILVCNDRLNALVPAGGRFEDKRDGNIFSTACRETKEEIGLILSSENGTFLDASGHPMNEKRAVLTWPYSLQGKPAQDHLYLFRLHTLSGHTFSAEKVWRIFTKQELSTNTTLIEERQYNVLVPGTRDVILFVMK